MATKTKKFIVKVRRTSWAFTDIEVEVPDTGNKTNDQAIAESKAVEEAGNHEFGSGQADYEAEHSTPC